MKALKSQLHIHVKGDPDDSISYDAKNLIDEADKLGFKVLAITCHREVVFEEEWKKYAQKKKILLLSGIELEIDKKHIVCINANEEIQKVKTFRDLEKYKNANPDSLIMAPHPFFPGKSTLKKELENNIDLFDAIEITWAYTKKIDFNRKAVKIAEKHKKTLIATADCHLLKQLKTDGYCLIEADPEISSVINAIKKNKIKNIHAPATIPKIIKYFILTGWQNFKGTVIKLCQRSS